MLKENPIPSSAYMCSFDIVSLFTNVPLDETIDICADALYRGENRDALSLSENSFRELLRMLTSGVEFSFNNIMYRQIDGVAMGSPLARCSLTFLSVIVSRSSRSQCGRQCIAVSLTTRSHTVKTANMERSYCKYSIIFTQHWYSPASRSMLDVCLFWKCWWRKLRTAAQSRQFIGSPNLRVYI